MSGVMAVVCVAARATPPPTASRPPQAQRNGNGTLGTARGRRGPIHGPFVGVRSQTQNSALASPRASGQSPRNSSVPLHDAPESAAGALSDGDEKQRAAVKAVRDAAPPKNNKNNKKASNPRFYLPFCL